MAATLQTASLVEGPGTKISSYKLIEQIGEGGMGVVYMAEQKEPVRRDVALKIIKPGMDTSQVVARFEAERQALALMSHPNVAKVLDAGSRPNRAALTSLWSWSKGSRLRTSAISRNLTFDSGWSFSSPFAKPSSTRIRRV